MSDHVRTLIHTILLLLLATPAAAQRVHPTPENLSHPTTAVIRRADTLSGDAATDALARRLRALRPVHRIGGEDATGGADFGRIADVTVDRVGRIIVLDEQDKSVSRWTTEGRAAGRFGRSGGGPLEFHSPTGLLVQDDGTVVVLDRALGLRRFAWDSAARYLDAWQAGRTYEDACASGNEIVALRWHDDRTVAQVIGPRGERVRGFGLEYRSDVELTNRLLSGGRLGCLHRGKVATTNIILPYVWIWDREGRSVAVTGLGEFSPMGVTEEENGLTYRLPPEGYEAVRRIVSVGADHFLVQLFFQTLESSRERAEYQELRSYLISSVTGRGVYLGTALPVIASAPWPHLIGWRNDPVPEVVILR